MDVPVSIPIYLTFRALGQQSAIIGSLVMYTCTVNHNTVQLLLTIGQRAGPNNHRIGLLHMIVNSRASDFLQN